MFVEMQLQVEYQFSDANLVANDFLMKIMNRDPEGYGEHIIFLSAFLLANGSIVLS